jgi:hypothetical protein
MKISKYRNKFLEESQFSNIKKVNTHDNALEDFIIGGIDRSKLASMIYGVSRNKGEGIVFIEESSFKKI